MQGVTTQTQELGPIVEFLPQPVDASTVLENVTVDPSTFGWSTRVGYEKYRPDPADKFAPFNTLGPIDSLYVYEMAPGGAKYCILFESGGTLYLYFENPTGKYAVASGRSIPAPGEASSVYTVTSSGVVVTNGRDAPLVVYPWPLPGNTLYMPSAMTVGVSRPLGFAAPAPAPDLMNVQTINALAASAPSTSDKVTGHSVSLWWPDQAGSISRPKQYGLGFAENTATIPGKRASFEYRCSFVYKNGSESPLSDVGTVDWELEGATEGFRYSTGMRLPIGGDGVVARKIYRTLNLSIDSPTYGDKSFYFLDLVRNNVEDIYFDAARSTAVGALAPLLTESIPHPSPLARTAAVYGDCLFLDGGPNDPFRLSYSKPGLPDQHAAQDYLTMAAPGGAVVRLFSHYRVLVVLRENGVDVVSGTYSTGFSVTTVSSQVACRSPNTVDQVPGLGVVFLAQDGVYALQGGFDGGSEMQLLRLSEPIKRTMRRLTLDCAARAVGRYSPMDRAYHLYMPVDGNDRPNLGAVYHTEKEGWSLRTGFPVGSLDRLYSGALIFGHNTGTEAGADAEAGIFVLSARRAMGGAIVADAYVENGPPTSRIKTAWVNLGDPQLQKKVQYITLWCMATGSVSVSSTAYKDFDRTGSENRSFLAQPPDTLNVPVYDSALMDKDESAEMRLVPLRIPVAQQSCSWFAAEVTTTDDLTIVGLEIEYKLPPTTTIAGKRG